LREDLLGREAAKDLIEEADLYGTGRRGCGSSAALDAVAGVEGVGELLAVGGGDVAEAF
jgi:hypothetical protein